MTTWDRKEAKVQTVVSTRVLPTSRWCNLTMFLGDAQGVRSTTTTLALTVAEANVHSDCPARASMMAILAASWPRRSLPGHTCEPCSSSQDERQGQQHLSPQGPATDVSGGMR